MIFSVQLTCMFNEFTRSPHIALIFAGQRSAQSIENGRAELHTIHYFLLMPTATLSHLTRRTRNHRHIVEHWA